MISNFWEEQHMENNFIDHHRRKLASMEIPEWILQLKCPYCDESLDIDSVRSIRFCLNTRNYGDLAIEVLCKKCVRMDTLYFREHNQSLSDFCEYFTKNKAPTTEGVLEDTMFRSGYNNIVEDKLTLEHKKGD